MQQNTVTKNNKNINEFLNGRIDITIFTTAKNDKGALELLKSFNMPFIDNRVN